MDRVPLPCRELFASPEVSVGPHIETKEAGNTESENLILKKLLQRQTLLQDQEMEIGMVKARSEDRTFPPYT